MNIEMISPDEAKLPTPSSGNALERHHRRGPKALGQPEVDFAGFWRILRKRKAIILQVTCGIFALALAYTFLITPKFRSESTIEFNRENTDSLALDEQRAMLGDATSMDYIVTQLTQVKTLLSDTLALRVINDLNLEVRPEFSGVSFLSRLTSKHADESGLPLERAPYRRVRILKVFHKNLAVTAVAGTRLINIRFMNPDPQVAARVVNAIVKDYKDLYFQNRYVATMEASGWLSNQLADLKTQVEASQQKLVDYQKQAGILGTDESHNIVMTRLEEVDKQLMAAEANRIVAHTVAQLVHNGNPELVFGLISGAGGSTMSPTTLTHLESLRSQQSELKMQYAQASTHYGAANPTLIEMKSKMSELDETIQQEIQNLSARAQSDYLAAQQNESDLRGVFETEKQEANKLNDSAVQYTILKHDMESNRTLYDGLLTKFKEAGVLAGLHSSNILVMDEGLPADRPARPIVLLNLGLGMMVGLMCGVGAALVAENVDDTITTAEDAEDVAMVPVLGVIPTWKLPGTQRAPNTSLHHGSRESGVSVFSYPRSQPSEAFRAIRTSIIQSTRRDSSTVILVTSPSPGEGKSTVSLNLAVVFAQQAARVLLVEADMRRPVLNADLNLDRSRGLSSMLKGEPCADFPIVLPSHPNLSVIPAGPQTSYPAELLGSDRMKELIATWRAEYDYIVFDTPPALMVTDALVLASHCDAIILIARSKVTRRLALFRASALFSRIRFPVLGIIVNGFDPSSADFAAYYGYENNSHSGAGYFAPLPK
jgi:capsular exopolysaccharide synthesis family protein